MRSDETKQCLLHLQKLNITNLRKEIFNYV